MKDALINYSKKAMARPNYYNPGEYEGVVSELKTEFQRSILVPRTTKTNFESFRSRFGFELPDDIKDYINLYWHSYIEGAYDCYKQDENGEYYKFDEGQILFPVLKHNRETDDDVLFQKNGVYDLTEQLYKNCKKEHYCCDDITKEVKEYICIGWTGYAAHAVLYKIATGEIYLESWREDRLADDKPIAASLSELINNIYFKQTKLVIR